MTKTGVAVATASFAILLPVIALVALNRAINDEVVLLEYPDGGLAATDAAAAGNHPPAISER